jgi:hypothetical protein
LFCKRLRRKPGLTSAFSAHISGVLNEKGKGIRITVFAKDLKFESFKLSRVAKSPTSTLYINSGS